MPPLAHGVQQGDALCHLTGNSQTGCVKSVVAQSPLYGVASVGSSSFRALVAEAPDSGRPMDKLALGVVV
ncbi:hypothetical protein TNCV_1118741 [Trichonephila clavipes]|uniref:Uncharacterized protein n=1 Tax=Trichonephila clavipes TaxID=2585209 RepID=A0A8X6T096_TRICX|nr:hypothetical protein TNCV_1118741 [Trichonephila clavipes]